MMSKLLLALPAVALAFAPAAALPRSTRSALNSWQPNRDFNAFGAADSLSREERSQRFAGAGDREGTLQKPLGVVLEQDAQKHVYVAEIDAGGNADLSGKVKVGDVVTMTSATFGDQMWSCRGVGLSRVLRAIKVRQGTQVTLVLEGKAAMNKKVGGIFSRENKAAAKKAAESEEEKRERPRAEVQEERGAAAKGWFGIF